MDEGGGLIRTPVPKCWQRKMMVLCLFPADVSNRERRGGKPQAVRPMRVSKGNYPGGEQSCPREMATYQVCSR